MSNQYPGGIITKNPATPSGPYENSTAPGIWTLTQQAGYAKQGIWPTAGNVDPSAFIENLFSCFLYTGTGATQTITNGIDLSTKGGLVWIKSRDFIDNHNLFDTARGATNQLFSNLTNAQSAAATSLTAFNTSGFSLGNNGAVNANGFLYASWTFREQAKFFDVVTYTGTGSAGLTVPHNLGSVPGCIMVKCTSVVRDWAVYHRSLGGTKFLKLNATDSAQTANSLWNDTNPTSTVFTVGNDQDTNTNGATYVAYIFAHDAGGFGVAGTDNVISCGTFTTDGSGLATVTLGYEPQWTLQKSSDAAGNWFISDVMRGMTVSTAAQLLRSNLSSAESAGGTITPTATGFTVSGYTTSASFIYIAIRRGPMKVPTLGTTVFSPDLYTGNGATQSITSGSPPLDLVWIKGRTASNSPRVYDRLRGATKSLSPDSTAAETTRADGLTAFTQTGFTVGSFGNENESGISIIAWDFRRAPSFFDEVCYTGTGSNTTFTHNLGVVPELMIVKRRDTTADWDSYCSALANTEYVVLNTTAAKATGTTRWNSTTPTSSVFSVGTSTTTNASAGTYVAYLFATCAGVSKVGSYTGTGTTLQINCGFTAGARFVLIKRTDSTGDWYVWDSARGIVAGNDPYLLLNTSANEVTGTDYVDTYSAGFEISSTAPAAINASAGTFIFLAIA